MIQRTHKINECNCSVYTSVQRKKSFLKTARLTSNVMMDDGRYELVRLRDLARSCIFRHLYNNLRDTKNTV